MLSGRRFWFVGIGGAGMSALALLARAWGADVAGSDTVRSRFVPALEAAGIPVVIGRQRAEQVPPDAEVIVSTAIPPENPELEAATRLRHRG